MRWMFRYLFLLLSNIFPNYTLQWTLVAAACYTILTCSIKDERLSIFQKIKLATNQSRTLKWFLKRMKSLISSVSIYAIKRAGKALILATTSMQWNITPCRATRTLLRVLWNSLEVVILIRERWSWCAGNVRMKWIGAEKKVASLLA